MFKEQKRYFKETNKRQPLRMVMLKDTKNSRKRELMELVQGKDM